MTNSIFKLKTFLVFFIFWSLSQTVSAALNSTASLPGNPAKTTSYRKAAGKKNYLLINSAVNNLSLKEYGKLCGEKLSLKQKLGYLIAKHEIKTGKSHSKPLMALEGFALGLFLGPPGVLIAYLTSKDKTLRNWSVIGGVLSVVLFIFILATFVTAFQGITFNFM